MSSLLVDHNLRGSLEGFERCRISPKPGISISLVGFSSSDMVDVFYCDPDLTNLVARLKRAA
jgi:hypothetical protein